MKKNMIAVLVLIGLIAYGGYDYIQKTSSDSGHVAESGDSNLEIGVMKGQLAPDFALMDLHGNKVQLSDFKGKKVLVNFWATWCPPCRVEMPHMRKFYEDFQGDDVVILGVNLTPTEEDPETVLAFVQEQQLTFPILLDEEGAVMQTYQVYAYPTTYVLDSDGVIREIFQGAITYDIMKETVSKIK